jgi:hypothetical protein
MAPSETIFGAQEHNDKEEGRGGARVVGWFATKGEAQRVSDALPGVFGSKNDLSVTESVLYDMAEEYPGFSPTSEARQRRIEELEAELAALRSQEP